MTPLFSVQQRRVCNAYGVTVCGIDAKHRPVVSKKHQWGDTWATWAVLRSGDPADVSLPVQTITPDVLVHLAPVKDRR